MTVAKPWQDFHVYAMEWYPDRIDVFVDGNKYFTFQNEGTGVARVALRPPAVPADQPRDRRRLGRCEGIDDTLFPHRYYIDYVRIFKG